MTTRTSLELLKNFLDSLSNKNTRDLYLRGIRMFSNYYNRSVSELLEMRKSDLIKKPNEDLITAKQRASRFEKLVEKFYNSLIKPTNEREAYSPSSAYNYCKGILQLLRYYNMTVSLRRGSPITEGSKYEGRGRYELKITDIRKMFWKTRDLKTKLELSLATDLGWRISDFLSIQVFLG